MGRGLITLILLLFAFATHADNLTEMLQQLDNTILQRDEYEDIKCDHILKTRKQLTNKNIRLDEKYYINTQLYTEYESYICDSAFYYLNESTKIAMESDNQQWIDECRLRRVFLLSISGLYAEALDEISKIDKTALSHDNLMEYYSRLENVYLYKSEYAMGNEYTSMYHAKMNLYRDTILQISPPESNSYIYVKGPVMMRNNNFGPALDYLLPVLSKLEIGTRQYSIISSIVAFTYECMGDIDKRKEYLIISAISDIMGVVKENQSLRCLAEILYKEGEIERANRYMKISIDDATKYNARLRNIQAAQMFSIIDNSYQVEREAQQSKQNILLYIVSILSILLLSSLVYMIMQMKKVSRAHSNLAEANRQLNDLNEELTTTTRMQEHANNQLKEANSIKEEYIGRFLELCSKYIDNLESYRRRLIKKANTGKVEDLYKDLKSSQFIEDELKEFQINFDNSFLNIFTNFVEEFNALFPEDKRIYPKPNEMLTTEHRIFALIRLGITDSGKIASFLHYSLTTIYTYRSKLKNRSLNPDDFDANVSKIGSFKS